MTTWITPSEAERHVAGALGSGALLSGAARQRLYGWFWQGKVRLIALEVEKWVDKARPAMSPVDAKPGGDPVRAALKLGILNASELPLEHSMVTEVQVSASDWLAAAEAGFDEQDFWQASELSHRLATQRHPLARIVYSGVRIAMEDVERRLQIDGLTPLGVAHSNVRDEAHVPPFNDDERREWMETCEIADGDEAHREYKRHPRFDGTKQSAWRIEWRSVHGRPRGRPPKS
ncbi:hypothetical protein KK137_06430 [Croceibacterium sp. LX-88]|uniref:HEPN domain-containing protein n=1 Tax=Croceibacterium selenioxidans TaxID=2838833 RepID=A0ABS5W3B0_9SPHN|nr:hypothetical protein [Croceibacterium selenioxidans]MBT2133966.1 hypothetical protein [Croceibacterium selenioxidans]